MFLIHPQSKPFSRRNLFLISTILNNSAILKITLTTGLLLIFSKFIIFNTIFFQNLTLNTSTKEQIQIYSFFLRKFFRNNYQLVWHSKCQSACINSPQQFTIDELLPFIDTSGNHHPQYYNLFEFPPSQFVYLTHDSNGIDTIHFKTFLPQYKSKTPSLKLPQQLKTFLLLIHQINILLLLTILL